MSITKWLNSTSLENRRRHSQSLMHMLMLIALDLRNIVFSMGGTFEQKKYKDFFFSTKFFIRYPSFFISAFFQVQGRDQGEGRRVINVQTG